MLIFVWARSATLGAVPYWGFRSLYTGRTCPTRNVNKEETCSVWTNSMVPARRISVNLFCITRNLGQCGKYIRSLAIPLWTSFTVTLFFSGRDYRICSYLASFRLIHVPPWTSLYYGEWQVYRSFYAYLICCNIKKISLQIHIFLTRNTFWRVSKTLAT
jgi:hypothetical protein